MEFQWVIKASHEKIYQDFVERYKNHDLVKSRISRNLKHINVEISKATFWRTLVGCLLTTQQQSGEGSRVSSFLRSDDKLLDVDYCLRANNLIKTAEDTLAQNGLRRTKRIAGEIKHAADWLKEKEWHMVENKLHSISSHTTTKKERGVARFLQEHFIGLGPKQSRNLIQWMGLSKYEIPLDSRMVKVLRELNFPVPLSPSALADEAYYCFIEDGIQMLMGRIDVYPCVFDACAFAKFEKNA